MKVAVASVFLAACAATGVFADDCRYSNARQADLGADGASSLRVKAGAGRLRIQGQPGLGGVRVRGQACATSQDLFERLTFTAERRGSAVVVEAGMREGDRWGWDRQAWTDLEIEAPAGLAVEVEDGSGELEIRGVGALRVRDGSGGLRIDGVTGDLRVWDGSGILEIYRVSGEVRLDDGSGEIRVNDVGSLVVMSDGSGGIVARAVKGSVRVDRDGSGSIVVEDVGGDFVVSRDGSGGIQHAQVRGRVRVPADR